MPASDAIAELAVHSVPAFGRAGTFVFHRDHNSSNRSSVAHLRTRSDGRMCTGRQSHAPPCTASCATWRRFDCWRFIELRRRAMGRTDVDLSSIKKRGGNYRRRASTGPAGNPNARRSGILPAFQPRRATKEAYGRINVPVRLGTLSISPKDFVVADANGIVSILHASVRQAIDFGLRSRKEGKQRLRTKSSRDAPYSRSSTWKTAFRRAGNRLRKRNKRELYEPED